MKQLHTKITRKDRTMTKKQLQLETAPTPVPFLQGEYFEGLCEIASACQQNVALYIPMKTNGIFQSLYFKRVFARAEQSDGSYIVGNFEMKNRYLYNYNKLTGTYDSVKDDNLEAFVTRVKEIIEKNDYKVFSLTPVANPENLDELIGA